MTSASVSAPLPRITIKFCIQCKWNLRAAYFAQELLSTFGTVLGEVALQPSTGGTFVVEIFYAPGDATLMEGEKAAAVQNHILWDRKEDGGFPETKELKRRVRDIIDPGRDLGHVDGKKKSVVASNETSSHLDSGYIPEAQSQEDVPPRPHAINKLHTEDRDISRKFTPMDVDEAELKEGGVKRNSDGTICEDCN